MAEPNFKFGIYDPKEADIVPEVEKLSEPELIHIREGKELKLGVLGKEAVGGAAHKWEVYYEDLDKLMEVVECLNVLENRGKTVEKIIHHRVGRQWRCVIAVSTGQSVRKKKWLGLDLGLDDTEVVAQALDELSAEQNFELRETLQYRDAQTKKYSCVFLGTIDD